MYVLTLLLAVIASFATAFRKRGLINLESHLVSGKQIRVVLTDAKGLRSRDFETLELRIFVAVFEVARETDLEY